LLKYRRFQAAVTQSDQVVLRTDRAWTGRHAPSVAPRGQAATPTLLGWFAAATDRTLRP